VRRRTQPAGSLVSLLDVLFILVFASLVQSHARGSVAAETVTSAAPVPVPVAPPVPAPPQPLAHLRDAAVAVAAQQVAGAPLIVARVGADNTLTELVWENQTRALASPLLEPSTDRNLPPAYHGDRSPALQVCGVIARELRVEDLTGHVVVIAPALPDQQRQVKLNEGLERDLVRCMQQQHAMALIVEPKPAAPPEAPTP